MSIQHKELASGRWETFSFATQMAHIGGEVERALNWRAKNNPDYSQKAFERALGLIDLTLDVAKGLPRLTELARTRETLVDYFFGTNQYGSDEKHLRSYVLNFATAVRLET